LFFNSQAKSVSNAINGYVRKSVPGSDKILPADQKVATSDGTSKTTLQKAEKAKGTAKVYESKVGNAADLAGTREEIAKVAAPTEPPSDFVKPTDAPTEAPTAAPTTSSAPAAAVDPNAPVAPVVDQNTAAVDPNAPVAPVVDQNAAAVDPNAAATTTHKSADAAASVAPADPNGSADPAPTQAAVALELDSEAEVESDVAAESQWLHTTKSFATDPLEQIQKQASMAQSNYFLRGCWCYQHSRIVSILVYLLSQWRLQSSLSRQKSRIQTSSSIQKLSPVYLFCFKIIDQSTNF
jgi:hypothetical protein